MENDFVSYVIVPYENFRLPRYRFGEQKAKCQACRYLSTPSEFVMRCTNPTTPSLHGQRIGTSCIDARGQGMPCGPDASLFAPATIATSAG